MKKLLFIIIPIAAGLFIYATLRPAKPIKQKSESEIYFESLKDYGFYNTPELGKRFGSIKERYKKETGLDFIADDEMIQLTTNNGMVWSQATNYKSSLPVEAGKQIIKSYNILKIKHYYNDSFWGWIEIGKNHYGDNIETDKGVFVVSYPEMFKDGAPLHSGKDPIAVVKIDGGWLELARWK